MVDSLPSLHVHSHRCLLVQGGGSLWNCANGFSLSLSGFNLFLWKAERERGREKKRERKNAQYSYGLFGSVRCYPQLVCANGAGKETKQAQCKADRVPSFLLGALYQVFYHMIFIHLTPYKSTLQFLTLFRRWENSWSRSLCHFLQCQTLEEIALTLGVLVFSPEYKSYLHRWARVRSTGQIQCSIVCLSLSLDSQFGTQICSWSHMQNQQVDEHSPWWLC